MVRRELGCIQRAGRICNYLKKGGEKGTKVCFGYSHDIKSRQHNFCSARGQAAEQLFLYCELRILPEAI